MAGPGFQHRTCLLIIGVSTGIPPSCASETSSPDSRAGLAVTGCSVYLENGVGLTESAGALVSWTNQANGAAPLLPGAAAPAYEATGFNGRPSILCTKASSQFATLDAAAAAATGTDQAWAVFVAAQFSAVPAAGDCVFSFGNSGGAVPTARVVAAAGPNWSSIRRDDANTTVTVTGSAPLMDVSRHVVAVIFTGTAVTVRVDGVAVTGANGAAQDVGAITLNRFTFAANRGSAVSGFISARLAELCVIDGPISDADRNAIEADIARLI